MTRGYVPDFKFMVVVFRATLSPELKVGKDSPTADIINFVCHTYHI